MKKCPYCAEEIQDEAIYCRWCEHDLVDTKIPGVNSSDTISEPARDNEPIKIRQKRPRNVFWNALIFGLAMGGIVFSYRMSRPMQLQEYGLTGQMNDAFFGGLSSVFIYGGVYSFIVWIKRAFVKNNLNLPRFSKNTGFFSFLFFGACLGLFTLFMAINVSNASILSTIKTTSTPNNQLPLASTTATNECSIRFRDSYTTISFFGTGALELCEKVLENVDAYKIQRPTGAKRMCSYDDGFLLSEVRTYSGIADNSRDLCEDLRKASIEDNRRDKFIDYLGAVEPTSTQVIYKAPTPTTRPTAAPVSAPTAYPTPVKDLALDITIKVENRCPERHVVIMDGPLHLKYDVAPGATVEWQGARGWYSWTIDGITSKASPQELTNAVWTLTLCD